MKRISFVCAAMLLLLSPVEFAWSQQNHSIEIVSRGIYAGDTVSRTQDERGVGRSTSTNIRLAVDTADVPMQLDVRFGFQYKLNGGSPNATAAIRKVVIFPPAGLVPAKTQQRIYKNETTINPGFGQIIYTGWRFTDAWELVPGQWTIQLWDGDRKLAEQRFNIRKP